MRVPPRLFARVGGSSTTLAPLVRCRSSARLACLCTCGCVCTHMCLQWTPARVSSLPLLFVLARTHAPTRTPFTLKERNLHHTTRLPSACFPCVCQRSHVGVAVCLLWLPPPVLLAPPPVCGARCPVDAKASSCGHRATCPQASPSSGVSTNLCLGLLRPAWHSSAPRASIVGVVVHVHRCVCSCACYCVC